MFFKSLNIDQINETYGISDPWDYVTTFEKVMANYCGYKYAVACDSNTNAIKLCLEYLKIKNETIIIPANTYVSVPNQIINSGNEVKFENIEWYGEYELGSTGIIDSACKVEHSKTSLDKQYKILSFHHRKIINIGRGGMILTNDHFFCTWARPMIYDGRNKRVHYDEDDFVCHGWHMYMTPEEAKRGLELLHGGVLKKHTMISGDHTTYKDLRLQRLFTHNKHKVKILNEWNYGYYYNNIGKIIETSEENFFELILPQEYALYDGYEKKYIELDELLRREEKTLIYYSGVDFRHKLTTPLTNIKIVYWDSIDFFINLYNLKTINLIKSQEKSYSKHFSIMTYLKNGRSWRLKVADSFFNKLLDKHTSTCLRIDQSIVDKVPDLLNKDPKDIVWDFKIDRPYESDLTDNFDTQILPKEYMYGALDIVLETITYDFFVTEKTIRPILTEKPFVVFSCKGFHRKMKDYGFEMFEELIDYSFDDIEDDDTRFEMLFEQLLKIKDTFTPKEIDEKTSEKTKLNYELFLKINDGLKICKEVPNYVYKRDIKK